MVSYQYRGRSPRRQDYRCCGKKTFKPDLKEPEVFEFKGGQFAEAVSGSMDQLKKDGIVSRIWDRDHTVWKENPSEIANRLGWLDSPGKMQGEISRIDDLLRKVREEGYTDALLMGMGGSSLGSDLFSRIFGPGEGCLNLEVLDSTDPAAVKDHAGRLDPARTLFIVSTKSGTTSETISFFKYFYNMTEARVGKEKTGDHFVAITDPGSSLESVASDLHFREIFLNDPDIGGRYSVLSLFGLVPAGLLGLDLGLLLERARAMASECQAPLTTFNGENTGTILGAVMGTLHNLGINKLTLIMSPRISPLGPWLEQLLAESTGKEGKGILPVEGENPATPGVYGKDRLFAHLTLEEDDHFREEILGLEKAGYPVIRIKLGDLHDLGTEFFRWEWATSVAGHLMGINPFDQPNVESAKAQTRKLLEAYRRDGRLPHLTPSFRDSAMDVYSDSSGTGIAGTFGTFMARAQPGNYAAIQAYLNPNRKIILALQNLRHAIRDRHRIAATVGFGPRFLHSTGQLHKGDAGKGMFIQITADDREDLPIPDEPGRDGSSLTFSILKEAQASGDRQALIEAGRRVIRFHIHEDIVEGIERLTEGVEKGEKDQFRI